MIGTIVTTTQANPDTVTVGLFRLIDGAGAAEVWHPIAVNLDTVVATGADVG